MTGENENPAPRTGRQRFWSYRRLWSAIVLTAVLVLFVYKDETFLEAVKQANQEIADAIKSVTPRGLIAGFNARVDECDFRWLVYCADKPSRLDRLRSDEGYRFGVPDRDYGYLAAAWRTIRTIAQLPAATGLMIKKSWHDGYVQFGLLIVFIAINVAVTIRVPVLLWPISLPVTTALASGLFWLVQQAFLLGTETFGALIQLLILTSYLIPQCILTACGYIRIANDLHDVARKSADVIGGTHHIRG
jgi:hypothetical protein